MTIGWVFFNGVRERDIFMAAATYLPTHFVYVPRTMLAKLDIVPRIA